MAIYHGDFNRSGSSTTLRLEALPPEAWREFNALWEEAGLGNLCTVEFTVEEAVLHGAP